MDILRFYFVGPSWKMSHGRSHLTLKSLILHAPEKTSLLQRVPTNLVLSENLFQRRFSFTYLTATLITRLCQKTSDFDSIVLKLCLSLLPYMVDTGWLHTKRSTKIYKIDLRNKANLEVITSKLPAQMNPCLWVWIAKRCGVCKYVIPVEIFIEDTSVRDLLFLGQAAMKLVIIVIKRAHADAFQIYPHPCTRHSKLSQVMQGFGILWHALHLGVYMTFDLSQFSDLLLKHLIVSLSLTSRFKNNCNIKYGLGDSYPSTWY